MIPSKQFSPNWHIRIRFASGFAVVLTGMVLLSGCDNAGVVAESDTWEVRGGRVMYVALERHRHPDSDFFIIREAERGQYDYVGVFVTAAARKAVKSTTESDSALRAKARVGDSEFKMLGTLEKNDGHFISHELPRNVVVVVPPIEQGDIREHVFVFSTDCFDKRDSLHDVIVSHFYDIPEFSLRVQVR